MDYRKALKPLEILLFLSCLAFKLSAATTFVCPPGPDGEKITFTYNFNSGRSDCINQFSTNTILGTGGITVTYSTITGAFTIGGGGGGSGTLTQVTTGYGLGELVNGSTVTVFLLPNTTGYIWDNQTSTVQNATAFVTSATATGLNSSTVTITHLNSDGIDAVTITSSGTGTSMTIVPKGLVSNGYQNRKGAVTIGDDDSTRPFSTQVVVVDSQTDSQNGGGMIEVWSDNPNHNDPKLWFHVAGHDSSPEIRDDANAPNWEMINTSTDNAHGLGKWEPAAVAYQGVDLQINNRAWSNGTFETLAYWHPLSKLDLIPGLYLNPQNVTDDGGIISSSGTTAVNFFTLNAHTVGLTAAPNTTNSWVNAMPSQIGSQGNIMFHNGTVANGTFTSRQWEWSNADFNYSTTAGVSVSTLTVTSSGTFKGAVNMTSNQIHNVLDPSSAQDAATKNYVDTHSSGGSSLTTATGSATGFTGFISTGTTTIVMDSNTFNGQLTGGSTTFYSLNGSSATLFGALVSGNSNLTITQNSGSTTFTVSSTIPVVATASGTNGVVQYASSTGALASDLTFVYSTTSKTMAVSSLTTHGSIGIGMGNQATDTNSPTMDLEFGYKNGTITFGIDTSSTIAVAGSTWTITGASGHAGNSVQTGSAGGWINFTAGTGGGGGTGSSGGTFVIAGGNGGNGSSVSGGAGGGVILKTGTAGTSGGGTDGNQANVIIEAFGSNGNGGNDGNVNIYSKKNTTAGIVYLNQDENGAVQGTAVLAGTTTIVSSLTVRGAAAFPSQPVAIGTYTMSANNPSLWVQALSTGTTTFVIAVSTLQKSDLTDWYVGTTTITSVTPNGNFNHKYGVVTATAQVTSITNNPVKADGSGNLYGAKISLSTEVTNVLSYNVNKVTANYTITSTDTIVESSCGVNTSCTDTLPAASSNKGLELTIFKSDIDTQTLTINPNGSDLINTSTQIVIYAAYNKLHLISDGSGWVMLEPLLNVPYVGELADTGGSFTAVAQNINVITYLLPAPVMATAIWMNVQTASNTGHMDVGIYDANGNAYVTFGSTAAESNTGSLTLTFSTATYIPAGQIKVAFASDNAVAQFDRYNNVSGMGAYRIYSGTNVPLPSTIALSGITTVNVPKMMIQVKGGITQ